MNEQDETKPLKCSRCGRERPRTALMVNQDNKLACSRDDEAEYDACMKLWLAL